jgi:hypothetical protein
MTTKIWLRIVNTFVVIFQFVIPIVVVLTTYFTVETSPKVAWNIIGVVLLLVLVISLVRYGKKRIIIRQQSGFKPSPYKVMVYAYAPSVVVLFAIWRILSVVQTDIEELASVVLIIFICYAISFILKFIQTHLENKLSTT